MVRPACLVAAVGLQVSLTTGLAAQTVGIAVCDDFLKKYEACVTTNVPEAQRTMFKGQFDQMRKMWSDAAKNPSAKTTLEGTCKQSAEQMKTSMSSFGCTF
jgi:hypothetical protein